jgi:enoyl-CoA hydratase/carnithine racemase
LYGPMLDALSSAVQDRGLRAVVLTGADGMFSAGGNLKRLQSNRAKPAAAQEASLDSLNAVVRAMNACSLPIIAAVEGAAAGAGLSLALGCDMIVAGTSAKFAMSHVRVGLSPDGGGTCFVLRSLPRQAAAELLLEGEPWKAERLRELGLVNAVVSDGGALAAALERADRLAKLSPHALANIKALMSLAPVNDLHAQLAAEKLSFIDCLFHADAGEAISAFLEKRSPDFDAAS